MALHIFTFNNYSITVVAVNTKEKHVYLGRRPVPKKMPFYCLHDISRHDNHQDPVPFRIYSLHKIQSDRLQSIKTLCSENICSNFYLIAGVLCVSDPNDKLSCFLNLTNEYSMTINKIFLYYYMLMLSSVR